MPKLGDNLFRLVPFPSHAHSASRLISHTSGRTTSQEDKPKIKEAPVKYRDLNIMPQILEGALNTQLRGPVGLVQAGMTRCNRVVLETALEVSVLGFQADIQVSNR